MYILTFNSPTTPKEIKIGYINEKIETYIPNPLRCYKCQKFGHHGSVGNGHTICGKCGEREPNYTTINCNQKTESKKEENYQELISKLLILGPKDWPEFIQEIKPTLLKLSSNSTNPKPITEHKPEKTSKYIETNPPKQPPKEEIRTISPHKNQPNSKNLSKEFTSSYPNTQNRTTSLTETEQN